MMPSLVPYDHLLLATILASGILEWRWLFPRFLAALAVGTPGARARYYALGILQEWGLAALVIALWITEHRPWSALLLGASSMPRLVIGWTLALLYFALALSQGRGLLTKPERMARIVESMGNGRALVPHTPGERRGFAALSITAGVCEELLFRGFVLWYATQWAGPVFGFVASCALFGFMHIYLGPKDVPRTAVAGILFYVIAVTAGSLLPAMLAHATADLVAGNIGYHGGKEKGDAWAPPSPAV